MSERRKTWNGVPGSISRRCAIQGSAQLRGRCGAPELPRQVARTALVKVRRPYGLRHLPPGRSFQPRSTSATRCMDFPKSWPPPQADRTTTGRQVRNAKCLILCPSLPRSTSRKASGGVIRFLCPKSLPLNETALRVVAPEEKPLGRCGALRLPTEVLVRGGPRESL